MFTRNVWISFSHTTTTRTVVVWACDNDRAVYCSFQKQTSYTFRGYVLLGEM